MALLLTNNPTRQCLMKDLPPRRVSAQISLLHWVNSQCSAACRETPRPYAPNQRITMVGVSPFFFYSLSGNPTVEDIDLWVPHPIDSLSLSHTVLFYQLTNSRLSLQDSHLLRRLTTVRKRVILYNFYIKKRKKGK